MEKLLDQLAIISNMNLSVEERLVVSGLQQEAGRVSAKPSALGLFSVSTDLLPGVSTGSSAGRNSTPNAALISLLCAGCQYSSHLYYHRGSVACKCASKCYSYNGQNLWQ